MEKYLADHQGLHGMIIIVLVVLFLLACFRIYMLSKLVRLLVDREDRYADKARFYREKVQWIIFYIESNGCNKKLILEALKSKRDMVDITLHKDTKENCK